MKSNLEVFVYIKEFGNSSIVLGIRFYVKSSDYYDIEVLINDRIMDALGKAKIKIPFNQLEVTMLNQ